MKKRNRSVRGLTSGRKPRSRKLLERGIETDADCVNLMSALMYDLVAGRVSPRDGNRVTRMVKIRE